MSKRRFAPAMLALLLVLGALAGMPDAQMRARDPGVRSDVEGIGTPLPDLTPGELKLFQLGKEAFQEVDTVGSGLGPRFNLDGCLGCHGQPTAGGTSPAVNPQIGVAAAFGARNVIPPFLTADGPVREVRFKYRPDGSRDGSVHNLFVISGRLDPTGDASACQIAQEDFEAQAATGNLTFRIPTPLFGAGLIEQIPDGVILANQAASRSQRTSLGIAGRPHFVPPASGTANRSANDGTISRFGWKAQTKSLLLFSGEAYAIEMGITNELFPTERDETPACQHAPTPNDVTNAEGITAAESRSAMEKFTFFMRFLAPPAPASPTHPDAAASIARGRSLFESTGCGACHTPTLTTGNTAVAALRNKPVNLYSDLLLHAMGPGLDDDIVQGGADPDEFRTAPLWGLGHRIFLLHDGRTTDLVEAILAHRSGPSRRFRPSEANAVIGRYNRLGEAQKQDLLNFLRSL